MNKVIYKEYKDDYFKDLLSFFKVIDNDFLPPISERKEIKDYLLSDVNEGVTYLAIDEDKIIGMINFQYNQPRKNECYINTVAVDPNYRKQGIGSKLIEKVFEVTKKKEFKKIKTRTWSTNDSGLGLYRKLGFKLDYIVRNDRGAGIDSIYLKKA